MALSHGTLMYFHSADGHPLGPHFIANNTLVNGGFGFDMDGDSTTHYTILNNIWQGVNGGNTWAFHQESSSQTWATLDNVNGNDYFQLKASAWNWNATIFTSLASWKSGCSGAGVTGCDSSSSGANPNLSVTYTLNAASAAIALGSNLTTIAIGNLAALLFDKAGFARPGGATAWDSGAYQTNSSAPAITTSSLPGATRNTAYSTTVSASGGTLPYAWSITAGTLPTGLSLAAATGIISGTPTVAGTFSFTVQVTDAGALSNSRPLSIVVNAPPQVTVLTSSLPNGAVGIGYGATVTASGGTTPYTWSISAGSLPGGLVLNASTGFISGTPTASGVSSFTVKVIDVNSTFDTKPLTITVPIPNTSLGAPTGIMP